MPTPLYWLWPIAQAIVLLLPALFPSPLLANDELEAERDRMVSVIERIASEAGTRNGTGGIDERVLKVMTRVPRHEFVPVRSRDKAYDNRPLPIGFGQTISQPFIVAWMTDILDVSPDDVVLEVGTGSGYQAAVLSQLVSRVFTIEIIEKLGQYAEARLKKLEYANIDVRIGDGYFGWKEHAPFDAIIVTAAASHIPPPLVRQLKPGGRMIIPVGGPFQFQFLTLVEKGKDGSLTTRQIIPVSFVPLTGGH